MPPPQSVVSSGSTTQGWVRSRRAIARPRGRKSSPLKPIWSMPVLRWPIPDRSAPGAEIFPSCVKEGDFNLHQAVTAPYCTGDDLFSVPFAAIDTRGKPDWTMTFDDQTAFPTLKRRSWQA